MKAQESTSPFEVVRQRTGVRLVHTPEYRVGPVLVRGLEFEMPRRKRGHQNNAAPVPRLQRATLCVDRQGMLELLQQACLKDAGFQQLRCHMEKGFVRFLARFEMSGQEADVTFKLAVLPASSFDIELIFYDVRTYGVLPIAAPLVPAFAAQALGLAAQDAAVTTLVSLDTRIFVEGYMLASGYPKPECHYAPLAYATIKEGDMIAGLGSAAGLAASAVVKVDRNALASLEGVRHFAAAEKALATGAPQEAFAAYRHALESGRHSAFARERLLQIGHLHPGLEPETRGWARTALSEEPHCVQAHLALATIALKDEAWRRAVHHFEAATQIARDEGSHLDEAAAESALSRAAVALDSSLCVPALERGLQALDDSVFIHRDLFSLYQQAEDWTAALRIGERLVTLEDDVATQASLHCALGHLYFERLADVQRARQHFESALSLASDLPAALEGLAEVHLQRGEASRAVSYLAHLAAQMEAAGDDAALTALRLRLGDLWSRYLDDPECAAQRYEQVLQLDARHVPAHLRLAELALARDDVTRARHHFELVLHLANQQGGVDDGAEAQAAVGLARLLAAAEGWTREAYALLERALRCQPDDDEICTELIAVLRGRGAWPRLLEVYDALPGGAETHAERRVWLGAIEQARAAGQQDTADVTLDRYLGLCPADATAVDWAIAGESERPQRTFEAVRAALAVDNHSPQAARWAFVAARLGSTGLAPRHQCMDWLRLTLMRQPTHLQAARLLVWLALSAVEAGRDTASVRQALWALDAWCIAEDECTQVAALQKARLWLRSGDLSAFDQTLDGLAPRYHDDASFWRAACRLWHAAAQPSRVLWAMEVMHGLALRNGSATANLRRQMVDAALSAKDEAAACRARQRCLAYGEGDAADARAWLDGNAHLAPATQAAFLVDWLTVASEPLRCVLKRFAASALGGSFERQDRVKAQRLWFELASQPGVAGFTAALEAEALALQLGDDQAAATALEHALERGDSAEGQYRRCVGRLLVWRQCSGDAEGFLGLLHNARTHEPHSTRLYGAWVDVKMAGGDWTSAFDLLLQRSLLPTPGREGLGDWLPRFEQTIQLAHELAPARVPELLARYLAFVPHAAPPALQQPYGCLLAAEGDWQSLLSLRTLQISRGAAEHHGEVAEILHHRLGRSSEALSHYTEAVLQDPDRRDAPETWVKLLEIAEGTSRAADAAFFCSQWLRDAERGETLVLQAVAWCLPTDRATARQYLEAWMLRQQGCVGLPLVDALERVQLLGHWCTAVACGAAAATADDLACWPVRRLLERLVHDFGKPEQAAAVAAQLTAKHSQHEPWWQERRQLLESHGTEAQVWQAHIEHAQALAHRERWAAAEAALRAVPAVARDLGWIDLARRVAHRGGAWQWLVDIGGQALTLENPTAAGQCLEAAFDALGDDVNAWLQALALAQRLGATKHVSRCAQALFELDVSHEPLLRRCLQESGDGQALVQHILRFAATQPPTEAATCFDEAADILEAEAAPDTRVAEWREKALFCAPTPERFLAAAQAYARCDAWPDVWATLCAWEERQDTAEGARTPGVTFWRFGIQALEAMGQSAQDTWLRERIVADERATAADLAALAKALESTQPKRALGLWQRAEDAAEAGERGAFALAHARLQARRGARQVAAQACQRALENGERSREALTLALDVLEPPAHWPVVALLCQVDADDPQEARWERRVSLLHAYAEGVFTDTEACRVVGRQLLEIAADGAAHAELAALFDKACMPEAALHAWEAAADHEPQHIIPWGKALRAAGDIKGFVDMVEAVAKRLPDVEAAALYFEAGDAAATTLHNGERARRAYDIAAQLAPTSAHLIAAQGAAVAADDIDAAYAYARQRYENGDCRGEARIEMLRDLVRWAPAGTPEITEWRQALLASGSAHPGDILSLVLEILDDRPVVAMALLEMAAAMCPEQLRIHLLLEAARAAYQAKAPGEQHRFLSEALALGCSETLAERTCGAFSAAALPSRRLGELIPRVLPGQVATEDVPALWLNLAQVARLRGDTALAQARLDGARQSARGLPSTLEDVAHACKSCDASDLERATLWELFRVVQNSPQLARHAAPLQRLIELERRSLTASPRVAPVVVGLARALSEQGDFSRALDLLLGLSKAQRSADWQSVFDTIQAAEPALDTQARRQLADEDLAQGGSLRRALRLYASIVHQDPLLDSDLRTAARLAGRLGVVERAYAYYAALAALEPDDQEAARFVDPCREAATLGQLVALDQTGLQRSLWDGVPLKALRLIVPWLLRLRPEEETAASGPLLAADHPLIRSMGALLGSSNQIRIERALSGGLACEVQQLRPPSWQIGHALLEDRSVRECTFRLAASFLLEARGLGALRADCSPLSTGHLAALFAVCAPEVPVAVDVGQASHQAWCETLLAADAGSEAGLADALASLGSIEATVRAVQEARQAAWRGALWLVGDVAQALRALYPGPGHQLGPDLRAWIERTAEAQKLMRFALSEAYFDGRRRLGLALEAQDTDGQRSPA